MPPNRRSTDRWKTTDASYPRTQDQVSVLLINQAKMLQDIEQLKKCNEDYEKHFEEIKKYLFAGRVVFSIVIGFALTYDWIRNHLELLRIWK